MQNIHVVSRPKSHVLSNGDIVFGWDGWKLDNRLFAETVLVYSLHFQQNRTQLTGNQSAPFERT